MSQLYHLSIFFSIFLIIFSQKSFALSPSLSNVVVSSGLVTNTQGSCPLDEDALGACVMNSPYNTESVLRCYLASDLNCLQECEVNIYLLDYCEKTIENAYMAAEKMMECFLVGYCGHAKRGDLGSYVNTGENRVNRRTFLDEIEDKFGK